MNETLRNWAAELQSIAQAGLTYGRDAYDLELAEEKNTAQQIRLCFEAYRSHRWTAQFD